MKALSKSKILAFRQCPRRLWLEIHRPELRQESDATQATFKAGHTVGELARQLYDPKGSGYLIDVPREGYDAALERTSKLLKDRRPIFEAGFSAAGALAFSDILLPHRTRRGSWRMVEVKSSTSVKDYHQDDIALQAYVARAAGLELSSVAVAHIDGKWTYRGGGDYRGLLVEKDLSKQAFARKTEVQGWISGATAVAQDAKMPHARTGGHCSEPYECGFHAHCASLEPKAIHPVSWLPRVQSKALKQLLAAGDVSDMKQVPDSLLNDRQLRVKTHTLSGREFFDAKGAARALKKKAWPLYFLDFETTQFAVPIWPGTRPYQQLPFQFSLHRLLKDGALDHREFLDLDGTNPTGRLAEALVDACGDRGTIFAYYASFEKTRIEEMAKAFPKYRARLKALLPRIVDLLPITQEHYYHPSQQGSWSIKLVAPALFPELDYAKLEGIADGGAASAGYLEATAPACPLPRKQEIEHQLRRYCEVDTRAMVFLWSKLASSDIVMA